MSGLLAFARRHKLVTGHLTGIGAISHVNIGYFDPATKQYLRSERNEQAEVLSFTGNLALIETIHFFMCTWHSRCKMAQLLVDISLKRGSVRHWNWC